MPNNWPLVPLGEIALPAERPVTPVPGTVYRQIGVKWWGLGVYEREPIDGAATQYKTLYKLEPGDIIINKIWARHGSVAVVQDELGACYASGEFPMFTPQPARLSSRWFHWFTKTRNCWEQCDEKSRGTSGKNRIRPELFLEIKIPLPPLDEQRRIVARIEQLAAKIQEARSLRGNVQDGLDRLLVTMAHRPDLDETAKLRHGWKQTPLAAILNQIEDRHRVDLQSSYPNLGIYSFAKGVFGKPPILGAATSAPVLFKIRSGQFIYSRLFAFEGAYGVVPTRFNGYFVSGEYPAFECDARRVKSHFFSPILSILACGLKSRRGAKVSEIDGSVFTQINSSPIVCSFPRCRGRRRLSASSK